MYKIDEKVLQATINYLAVKPYQEVVNLLAELVKLEKIEEVTKDE